MTNRIRAERVEPSDISQVKVIDSASEISESYALYLDDESHSFDGKADMMFFPRSEQEVVAVLKYASDRGIPVTVQGARTGLTGAAVPLGGIVLNLEKMNRSLYIDCLEDKNTYSICAEPGVLLEDLVKAVVSKTLRGIESNGTAKNQDALRRFMQDQDLYSFPVDPTETTAWLGGIVACNASGARTFRYGAVRDWVRHLRVALINGDVLDIERGRVHAEDGRFEITLSSGETLSLNVPSYKMPRTKNAAGLFARQDMDLIDLFIGSEGILGVITQVELILEKLPRNIMTVMAFFPTEDDAVEFVVDARRQDSPIVMNFLEYFDSNAIRMIREKAGSAGIKVPALRDDTNAIVFFEFSYEEEEMEEKVMALEEMLNRHNSSSESSWAGLDRTELEKMKVVRHFVPETINALIAKRKQQFHEVHKIGTDMAVPDEALREYLRFYKDVLDSQGMEYVIFGHIGNNHLHVNMLPRDNDEVKRGMDNYLLFAKKAVELGGTVAAEHGIGKLKRDFLRVMYGDKGIAEIQAVKSVLDPRWLLNRENMVPVPEGP
ncbi:MAG: FAD-binding oxidoreductase [Candidatus Thorarchaeota archaeon]